MKAAKYLREQERLRKARKEARAKEYANKKAFAESNPTSKLHKSFRIRFRNQVQLVEDNPVYAPVAKLRLIEKYGNGQFMQEVFPQLLKQFSEDADVQKAVARRKGTDDAR